MIFNAVGRILQPQAHFTDSLTKMCLKEVQVIRQKIIRMLNLNSIRRQIILREVSQILGDNHITAPDNGCRQYVPIIRVRQLQCTYATFITGNERIADLRVH